MMTKINRIVHDEARKLSDLMSRAGFRLRSPACYNSTPIGASGAEMRRAPALGRPPEIVVRAQ
jgi:hypothetical protein